MAVFVLSSSAVAGKIYKVVDAQGNVSYTDQPPAELEAQPVELEGIVNQMDSQTLQQKRNTFLRQLDKEKQAQSQKAVEKHDKVKQARQRLLKAEQSLAEAKVPKAADRIGTASGGNRLSQAYLKRLQAAEQEYDEAKRALKAIHR